MLIWRNSKANYVFQKVLTGPPSRQGDLPDEVKLSELYQNRKLSRRKVSKPPECRG